MGDRGSGADRRGRRLAVRAGVGLAAVGAGALGVLARRTEARIVPGRSRARPVAGIAGPPRSADVVIVGGGILGAFVALECAERGLSTVVCEKGVVAGEASGRAMGWVDCQFADPAKVELISRAKTMWAKVDERIGANTSYRAHGIAASLADADAVAGAEAWLQSVKGVPGFEARILRGADAANRFRGASSPPDAVLLTETDASLDPKVAAPAVMEAAVKRGARLIQHCAVRGIEVVDGSVSAVVTEKGPIACRSVVVCGGAWTPLLLRSLGVSVPQLQLYLSQLALGPVEGGPSGSMLGPDYGLRQEVDGGYSVGTVRFVAPILPEAIAHGLRIAPNMKMFWPMTDLGFSPGEFWRQLSTPRRWRLDRESPFERRRILEPAFRHKPYVAALAQLRQDFPAFAAAEVRERWAGVISTTLDNMPVISRVDGIGGLTIGSGFSFGLTTAPAAGEALADMVSDRKPKIDLDGYRLSRFSDGTRLVLRS